MDKQKLILHKCSVTRQHHPDHDLDRTYIGALLLTDRY
jgi:hypothetical protein